MEENHLLENKGELDVEDQETEPTLRDPSRVSRSAFNIKNVIGVILLLFTIGGNIFQYWHSHQDRCRSKIGAGVTGGITRPFVTNTEWSSGNVTRADELWKALAPNVGMVVVDKTFGEKMDLYATEPFPWDLNKKVYMLEGYHSLHCLMYIYRALREFEQGLPQTTPMHHHIHCLDTLRENAICSADDTLRPAGTGMEKPQNPGRWPQRECRNWDQLERWALQNSACFKRFPDDDPKHSTLEEWRWCPDGSPYIPAIQSFFGSQQ